jgi:hypothetical protein
VKKKESRNGLPDESWSLAALGQFCLDSVRREASDLWWRGKALNLSFEKCKGDGDPWIKWCEKYCPNWSIITIWRWRKIASEFTLAEVEGKRLSEVYDRLGLRGRQQRTEHQPLLLPAYKLVEALADVTGDDARPQLPAGAAIGPPDGDGTGTAEGDQGHGFPAGAPIGFTDGEVTGGAEEDPGGQMPAGATVGFVDDDGASDGQPPGLSQGAAVAIVPAEEDGALSAVPGPGPSPAETIRPLVEFSQSYMEYLEGWAGWLAQQDVGFRASTAAAARSAGFIQQTERTIEILREVSEMLAA